MTSDVLAVAAGADSALLPLPCAGDPLERLHGAQAIACEWALDRLEEAEPPSRVVVRAHSGCEALAAVVGVGLRQALAPDGAAGRVALAGDHDGRRHATAS